MCCVVAYVLFVWDLVAVYLFIQAASRGVSFGSATSHCVCQLVFPHVLAGTTWFFPDAADPAASETEEQRLATLDKVKSVRV